MISVRPRLSLVTLLLLPAMFALGWWARGINYKRDVYSAADRIALETGGVFIPEVGLFRGGKELAQRFNSMSPEAKAEMERRMEYLDEIADQYDDPKLPPQPTFVTELKSGFGIKSGVDGTGEIQSLGEP